MRMLTLLKSRMGLSHKNSYGDLRDRLRRLILLKRLLPTRLETRTKESNTYASLRVINS